MAFSVGRMPNSPLGQYMFEGTSRGLQTRAAKQEAILGRQHQKTMQDDRQNAATTAATNLFGRQKTLATDLFNRQNLQNKINYYKQYGTGDMNFTDPANPNNPVPSWNFGTDVDGKHMSLFEANNQMTPYQQQQIAIKNNEILNAKNRETNIDKMTGLINEAIMNYSPDDINFSIEGGDVYKNGQPQYTVSGDTQYNPGNIYNKMLTDLMSQVDGVGKTKLRSALSTAINRNSGMLENKYNDSYYQRANEIFKDAGISEGLTTGSRESIMGSIDPQSPLMDLLANLDDKSDVVQSTKHWYDKIYPTTTQPSVGQYEMFKKFQPGNPLFHGLSAQR